MTVATSSPAAAFFDHFVFAFGLALGDGQSANEYNVHDMTQHNPYDYRWSILFGNAGILRIEQPKAISIGEAMESGQGNGGSGHDDFPSRAAIIEDEPASDFYASVVGVKPRKRRRILPQPKPRMESANQNNNHLETSTASLPVVDAEKEEINANGCSTGDKKSYAIKSEMGNSLHRAFANPPANQTSLSLDKSNKGYAMLTSMGWSEESGGLGRSRQGEMLPVKTTLKMDKRGLGSSSRKRGKRSAQGSAEARITHKHHDIEAAAGGNHTPQAGPSGETKAERKKRKKKEAEKASRNDRRVRMMLRSDIPPEYEDLYVQLHK